MAQFSPRYILYTCFKRWRTFVVFFIFYTAMTALYIIYTPWRYQSDAQMVVKVDEQDIAEGDSRLSSDQMRQQASGEIMRRIINTHLDIFLSKDVARAALTKLEVARSYPEVVASPPRFFGTPFDAGVERLSKDFSVTVAPNSNILQVSLLNRNPVMAQEGLRTLINVFLGKDAEVMRNPRVKFLTDQVSEGLAQVKNLQDALLRYKKENGITSIDTERSLLLTQRDLLEQNLASANTQSLQIALVTAQVQMAANEQEYLRAEQKYATGSPLLQRAREAVTLSRNQYKVLLALMSNGRPRQGQDQQGNGTAPAEVDTSLFAKWTGRYNIINDRLDVLAQSEGKLLELQRQLDVATQAYLSLVQRARNARFTEALNQQGTPSIVISQAPTLPYSPAQPRIVLVSGLGVVIGLMGGLALCFFLEAVDETLGFPEEVEPLLGLPILATLNYNRAVRAIARETRQIAGSV